MLCRSVCEVVFFVFLFFKQKTAYEVRISDWSSDVCSSDLFSLPPVQGRTLGLSSTDLKGEVSLVNVFASWCTACREEHPLFMQLKADNVVPIHGLNHRDRPPDAAKWLDDLGDPYTRSEEHTSELQSLMRISYAVFCL